MLRLFLSDQRFGLQRRKSDIRRDVALCLSFVVIESGEICVTVGVQQSCFKGISVMDLHA